MVMAGMKSGLHISVIEVDPYFVELRIQAANGVFSGLADVLVDPTHLVRVGDVLRGFPTTLEDVRELEFGNLDESDTSSGGLRLRFYCVDRWGHVAVEVTLQHRRGGLDRSMDDYWDTATIHIEKMQPAQIDLFVESLENLRLLPGTSISIEPE